MHSEYFWLVRGVVILRSGSMVDALIVRRAGNLSVFRGISRTKTFLDRVNGF